MLDPVADIDVAQISEIANTLASREKFILEYQQWRSPNDRARAYKEVDDAKECWIHAATQTHDAVEKAKEDAEHGKAKLQILAAQVVALQPDNIESQKAAKLRFEYIGEISDSTQALIDMVATGIKAKIDQAVKIATAAKNVLIELVEIRSLKVGSSWVSSVNAGKGANVALKNCVSRVTQELYPNKLGKKLALFEAVDVQAGVIERAGGSTTIRSLVSKINDTAFVRGLLISLAILVSDIVNTSLNGEPIDAITTAIKGVVGIAAGMATSVAAEAFIESSALAAAGPATIAVLGVLGGAIAGLVVGAVVGLLMDALVDLLMGISESSYEMQWKVYLNTPIVYKVIVLP